MKLEKHLIVGLGSIGKKHAQVLRDHEQIIAGVDPYSKEKFEFECFSSLDQGLDWQPDMVWLCTPTQNHAIDACTIIEKGIPLFIEKPVAHTLAHAHQILAAYEQQNRPSPVWVGCNMRYHPAVRELKRQLEKGCIGAPLIIKIHFSHWLPNMRPGTDYRRTYAAQKEGGGIILDDIHDIDLACWLAGSGGTAAGCHASSGALEMAAEDVAFIAIRHDNRVMSMIHMDYLRQNKSRGIEIIGRDGTLEWRSLGKNPEEAVIKLFKGNETPEQVIWKASLSPGGDMFDRQFKAIQEQFNNPENFKTGLSQGIDALALAMKVKTQ